tara:strand:- start:3269 stop:4819 length:1551 start_codon:yes stop_codon:yes gene_type:complete
MAATSSPYTQTGTDKQFTITFPYLEATDIKAQIDGVQTTAFFLANANTLEFNTAPPLNSAIIIYRQTDDATLPATFFAGSSIRADGLNDNFKKTFYIGQETSARALTTLGGYVTGDLRMGQSARVIFEGATDDANETTLNVVDPTADRTINLPNVSGTLVTTGDTDTISTGMIADTQLKDLATNLTSTATELNQLDGKTISDTLSTNSTTVPTGTAVNSWVVNLLNSLGNFTAISNEVSFPNTNPDVNNDAGTVVSITDAGGVVINSSGVSTTGRTVGGATVTINGFPSALQSKTLPTGMGLLVQTTSTLNTYTYHKAIGSDADIILLSDTVESFNARYRISSSDPSSDNNEGDLVYNTTTNIVKVYDNSLNSGSGGWKSVQLPDSQLTNINIIAGELGWVSDFGLVTETTSNVTQGSINTVAESIADVNRYAEEYKISSSAPGSPSAGDLWFDTGNNKLKVYDSSAWTEVGAGSSGNFPVNQSAKTTGSLVYYDGSEFKADATTTKSSIVIGGNF